MELEEKIGELLQKARYFFGLRLWAAKLIEKYPKLNTVIIIASFAMDIAIYYALYYGIKGAMTGFTCPLDCHTCFGLNYSDPKISQFPQLVK